MQPASSMDQQFIDKLTNVIEQNLEKEDFGVEQLARELGMSRITLHRKVKALVKKSVSEFIRETRLKHAHRLLQQKTGTVSEIAYKVGFTSVPYFSRCFHNFYGYTPGEVLKGLHPPIDKTKTEKQKKSANKTLVLFTSGVIIIVALFFALKTFRNNFTQTNSSIIITPPDAEKKDSATAWVFNGLYHEIRYKLANIENIDVCSEYTAKYYANSTDFIKASSKAGIDYILKFNSSNKNGIRTVYVTLTDLNADKLVLNEPIHVIDFTENFNETTTKLATILNNKIKGEISEEDEKVMAQKMTESTEANILYYQAMDYLERWDRREGNKYLHMARNNLKKAIEIDSTFSEAYVMLGSIYMDKIFPFTTKWPKKAHELLDSGLLMANLALKYDEKSGWAWSLKYRYYEKNGLDTLPEAQKCLRMRYKYRDSESGSYIEEIARARSNFDYYGVMDYFYKYLETKPDEELIPAWMLRIVTDNLISMNFPNVAKKYAYQLLLTEKDTAIYHEILDQIDIWTWNLAPLEKKNLTEYKNNRDSIDKIPFLIYLYYNMQKYDEAYKYVLELEKLEKKLNKEPRFSLFRAHLYMKNGRTEEAKEQFQKVIEKNREIYNEEFSNASKNKITYAIYASAYSGMGEKEKALQNLQKLTEREVYSILLLNQVQHLSSYDNIRDEPEYNRIMQQLWDNYYEERNRIEKLLKEKGELTP